MTKKQFKGKKILITGGAGFIGSWMCETLLNAGAQVVAIDNFLSGKKENIEPFKKNPDFIFIEGDANDFPRLSRIFEEYSPDYVIHYAATVGVRRTLEDPMAVLRDIEGIKHILELSRKYDVKKAIFASSSEIYGEPQEVPEVEDETPLNARLPYAVVKSMGEVYFRAYYECYGLPTVSLRFFNVYGPRQDGSAYGFVTAIFMNQVLSGEPPTVFGDGTQTRDFVYIEDNINATLKALVTSEVDGMAVNIGTGVETQIIDLASKIIKTSGKELDPVFLPAREKGDMMRRCPDVTRMKTVLGYTPEFSLRGGLHKTYEWYRSKK